MTPAPPITCVSEVVLNVDDLNKVREFYTQVLGFPVHREVSLETSEADPDGEPTISFLTISDTKTPLAKGGHPAFLVLIDYKRHVFSKDRVKHIDGTNSTLNHLAFEVAPEDFDQHRERLESLGISTFLTQFPALQAQAMFFGDPEGNTIELIAHVPDTPT
ncbi:MAG: VOC family protein [Planctomycetota bacterium]